MLTEIAALLCGRSLLTQTFGVRHVHTESSAAPLQPTQRVRDPRIRNRCWCIYQAEASQHATLRAHEYSTRAAFVDKNQASLAKFDLFRGCSCTSRHKNEHVPFPHTHREGHPGYTREQRTELRRRTLPKINDICNELVDKVRRDDRAKQRIPVRVSLEVVHTKNKRCGLTAPTRYRAQRVVATRTDSSSTLA
jgi:hypothetical protein